LRLVYSGRMKQAEAKTDDLKPILRKAGFKATPSRLKLLALLEKSKHPLSPQEIIEALRDDCDPVTVYRTVYALKSKGIIRQVDLRHNHAHYELTGKTEHHHLVCTGCGKIEDVEECDVELIYGRVIEKSRGFGAIAEHALEFYGTCKACIRKHI
jgi:Fur family transcriptional regulator, ferric uptake regulator